jgi:cobalamin biosynthesis protein CobD/CbiB
VAEDLIWDGVTLRTTYQNGVVKQTLTALERHLHALIRERAGALVEEHKLRLAELEPLTEVTDPTFWFPVLGMYGGFRYTAVQTSDRFVAEPGQN